MILLISSTNDFPHYRCWKSFGVPTFLTSSTYRILSENFTCVVNNTLAEAMKQVMKWIKARLSQCLSKAKPKYFYHPNQLSRRCVVKSFNSWLNVLINCVVVKTRWLKLVNNFLARGYILKNNISFFVSPGKKKGGKEYDISLLDLLMYLKTSDLVLKANTAGYIMHLTFDDEDAKRKIRYHLLIVLCVCFQN